MTKMLDLITKLSSEVKPTKPLGKPIGWIGCLLLLLVLYAVIVQIGFGVRGDLLLQLTRPLFLVEIALMLLLFVTSVAAAVLTMYPDLYQKSRLLKLPFIIFFLLLGLFALQFFTVYGFALAAGEPIADVASAHGAGVFRGNVVYIFSNTGAFISTTLYCLWLHRKHKTLSEIVELPAGTEKSSLPVNWAMAVLTGCLWYGQFFFYNLGHVRMGEYQFTSWAIHMIMLILFSIVVGFALREWRGARLLTKLAVGAAFLVLVGAVLALTYGNHLAEVAPGHGH